VYTHPGLFRFWAASAAATVGIGFLLVRTYSWWWRSSVF
jgi:hypothetical protein